MSDEREFLRRMGGNSEREIILRHYPGEERCEVLGCPRRPDVCGLAPRRLMPEAGNDQAAVIVILCDYHNRIVPEPSRAERRYFEKHRRGLYREMRREIDQRARTAIERVMVAAWTAADQRKGE